MRVKSILDSRWLFFVSEQPTSEGIQPDDVKYITPQSQEMKDLVVGINDICGEADRVTWRKLPLFGASTRGNGPGDRSTLSHLMVELVARIGSEVDQPSGLGDCG